MDYAPKGVLSKALVNMTTDNSPHLLGAAPTPSRPAKSWCHRSWWRSPGMVQALRACIQRKVYLNVHMYIYICIYNHNNKGAPVVFVKITTNDSNRHYGGSG